MEYLIDQNIKRLPLAEHIPIGVCGRNNNNNIILSRPHNNNIIICIYWEAYKYDDTRGGFGSGGRS